MIALPTTAGTAAEVTINYVITDEENVKKMVCVDPNDIPTLAVIDPELMLSMPRGLTAATGMDALTHAIEGLITLGAWAVSYTHLEVYKRQRSRSLRPHRAGYWPVLCRKCRRSAAASSLGAGCKRCV